MRLLLFGTGRFYQRHKAELAAVLQGDEIIGFVDNRAREIGWFEEKPVYLPENLPKLVFDRIILMSASHHEMRAQLLSLCIPEEKIFFFEQHVRIRWQGKVSLPCPHEAASGKKRVLIITHEMGYDGGTIVVTYAAHALMALGHVVTLAAPVIHPSLEREVRESGIDFVLCPAIPYLGTREIAWIEQYDLLLVNVFPNIRVACSMRKKLPVIWWIHEADDAYETIYPEYRERFKEYDDVSQMDGIRIFGVSRLAADIFSHHYPGVTVGVLPYGIPDEGRGTLTHPRKPIIFAIIGGVSRLKGQREFLRAVQKCEMQGAWENEAEIWLIGRLGDNPYAAEVRSIAEKLPYVKLRGVLTREEMRKAYQEIDVVVCASQQEMLSTVMVEGLMHGKICLTTWNNGVVDVLHDGADAYICKDNQPDCLAAALVRIMKDRDRWNEVRQRARAVYTKNFSMKKFRERLSSVLEKESD